MPMLFDPFALDEELEKKRSKVSPNKKLIDAASVGDPDAIREALDNGADPNYVRYDASALLVAVSRGNKECAKILIEAGAKPSEGNRGGWTPLHEAALQGDDVIQLMLKQEGVPVRVKEDRENNPRTPMLVAIENHHFEAASALASYDKNVFSSFLDACPAPIFWAIKKQDMAVLDWVASNDEKWTERVSDGFNVLQQVQKEGWVEGENFIRKALSNNPVMPDKVSVVDSFKSRPESAKEEPAKQTNNEKEADNNAPKSNPFGLGVSRRRPSPR